MYFCSPPITDLPDELLISIFQYSNSKPNDCIRLSHVCKRWESLHQNNNSSSLIWKFLSYSSHHRLLWRGRNIYNFLSRPFSTLYKIGRDCISYNFLGKTSTTRADDDEDYDNINWRLREEIANKKKYFKILNYGKMNSIVSGTTKIILEE